MSGEDIFGLIIMLSVSGSCGVFFWFLGRNALNSRKPVGFWTGKGIKAESISDIAAYNRENARLWKIYSLSYFVICILSVAGFWISWMNMLAVILLILVCTAGVGWLIWKYTRIYRKYCIK